MITPPMTAQIDSVRTGLDADQVPGEAVGLAVHWEREPGHPNIVSLVATVSTASIRPEPLLTTKRPRRIRRHHKALEAALLIGIAGHPSVAGGQAGAVRLIGVVDPALGR